MTFPEQIIIVLIPLVLPLLISLSAVLYQVILQRLPEKKREIVEQVVQTVVLAIEQTASNAAKELSSPEKKQAAMDLATTMLAKLHINVSTEMLSAMIEATVFTLNQGKSVPEPSNTR